MGTARSLRTVKPSGPGAELSGSIAVLMLAALMTVRGLIVDDGGVVNFSTVQSAGFSMMSRHSLKKRFGSGTEDVVGPSNIFLAHLVMFLKSLCMAAYSLILRFLLLSCLLGCCSVLGRNSPTNVSVI